MAKLRIVHFILLEIFNIVLGQFVYFDVFLGQMIFGKGLEQVKTSWRAKRLNFGRFDTITSRDNRDES